MNKALMKEAESLGINASMYYLLPPHKREEALRKDIKREKQRKEENDGETAKSETIEP